MCRPRAPDVGAGVLPDGYHVIHDRDPLDAAELLAILQSGGVTSVRLPAKSPDLSACAERFVRSIKEETLDRVVPLGGSHLRAVVSDYVVHYHEERNHQGLGNRLIAPAAHVSRLDGAVARRERLGGLLGYYCRDAA